MHVYKSPVASEDYTRDIRKSDHQKTVSWTYCANLTRLCQVSPYIQPEKLLVEVHVGLLLTNMGGACAPVLSVASDGCKP